MTGVQTCALPISLVLHGAADSVNHPDTSAGKEHLFGGGYERKVLEDIGHFPQREAAELVTSELIRFLAG